MNITRLFLQRPTLVFVLVSVMLFAGIISLMTIVKELFPNVSQPTITINAGYSGASVTEMRDNIVAPIEENLAGTTDLQNITSVVQQGQAQISATFTITSDQATDLALTEKAVQAAERQLPTNMQTPTVNIRDPAEETVVTLAIFSNKLSPGEMALYANNEIVPQIQQIPGISYANVGGAPTPAYEVEVDPTKLAARNLTLNDVINSISTENERVPGGYAYQPGRQTIIDVRGDVQTVQQVADLPIIASAPGAAAQTAGAVQSYTGGLQSLSGTVDPWTAANAVTRIGDVATVVQGNEPQLQYARINGQRGFFLSVQKTAQASEVDASNSFMQALPQLEREFPDIRFEVINVASKFTQEQMNAVTHTLLEAILLTALAMLFFLRSWRSAIVVCTAIPTSLAIAVTVMRLTGMTIDTISMLAMTLVIGILVDDSTVVLENIERHHRELNQSPEDAAYEGRMEIGAAAVVITLVDVVVFLPIAFIQGQVGRFLVEFALVIVISTLTSLFISFTVTPAMAGLWALKSHWKPWKIIERFGQGFDNVRAWYAHRVLPWALENRGLVVGACALSFVLSIGAVLFGFVGETFIPPVDRGEVFIQLNYPEGTPIDTVRAGAYKLEAQIDKSSSDVQHETTVAGAYSASFGGFVIQPDVAQIHIFLKENRKRSTYYWVSEYQRIVRRTLPHVTASVIPASGVGGGNSQPIDYLISDITGADPTAYAQRVLALLRTIPGATSANSSAETLAPEVSIVFNRQKAQALDIDLGQAAQAAGAAFGGNVATQFETTSGLEQVQVIYPIQDQTSLESLSAIPIRANNGDIVHLGDIASFTLTPTPPFVTRTNRMTVIHVDANVAPGSSLSNVENAFEKRLASLHLPPNVIVRPAPLGQQDFMHQVLLGMGISVFLSVILVFLLMVALYNSYSSPFIILFSVPVAAVGAVGALLITNETLNLFSLIGTILLVGIATKNGILLVDYANTLRARGRDKLAAIKESAFTRFRPIVMTSVSIVAAMFPLALALEPGTASHASLGIVVIGGVISSLVLTLLLIPIVYMWFSPETVTASNAPPESAAPSSQIHPTPV